MDTKRRAIHGIGALVGIAALAGLCLSAAWALSEPAPQQNPSRDVDVRIKSAEITRFEKPIRVGPQKHALEYQEALVLQLEVDQEKYDSLPPDIAPFLYIGHREYRIFHIDRQGSKRTTTLTFHIRDWDALEDETPMLLTIDHGLPRQDKAQFFRRSGIRFSKSRVQDFR